MASRTIFQFSPSKTRSSSAATSPQRAKQPSPEKRTLPFTTIILPQKRSVSGPEAGSPVKKLKEADEAESIPDAQLDVQLGSTDSGNQLAKSRNIKLSYSLVEAGRAIFPPEEGFTDLLGLFPTTFAAEVDPPYVIIRVCEVPPRPWPLTIAGLPVLFSKDKWAGAHERGRLGRGPKCLEDIDLHKKEDYSQVVLQRAVSVFQELDLRIRDIFWFAGFWQITVPDDTDFKLLPATIGSSPAFYRTISEAPYQDPAALRNKPPQGVEYDDTTYTDSPNALLRPGIMLGSSAICTSEGDVFKSTTSGVLVANQEGEIFITVASHGFEQDGLIYHPNPHIGTLIGKIAGSLPDTDISVARLNPGLRYINETFGSPDNPDGQRINGILPDCPPHLLVYDKLTMNNPFSGSCEGATIALGATVVAEDGKKFKCIPHEWIFCENGDQPVDGSCGSPILNDQGKIVGLFRYKVKDSNSCLAVSATNLQKFGYQICDGEQTFV